VAQAVGPLGHVVAALALVEGAVQTWFFTKHTQACEPTATRVRKEDGTALASVENDLAPEIRLAANVISTKRREI
jgi:hypothetical protein